MYVSGTQSGNSTWLVVGGVLLLLLIIFLVWIFWYYWGCSTISVSQQSFSVRADKAATIKPCNGYVQRLAFCAKEDTRVQVSITPQGATSPLAPVFLDLTADNVHWWQLTLPAFPNFSHVTISIVPPVTTPLASPSVSTQHHGGSSGSCGSRASVEVIAEIVSTNLCDCKKSCSTSCGTSGCSRPCNS